MFQTYAHSKLANIMFTKSLAEKWSSDGIRSYSCHPGFVGTNILNRASDLVMKINNVMLPLFGKNCWQGAQTQIHCCLSDDLVNGAYYMDCRQVTLSAILALKAAAATKLYETKCMGRPKGNGSLPA